MAKFQTSAHRGWGIGLLVLIGGAFGASVRAQVPLARVPDVEHRSGIVTRMTPVLPKLPPDDDRDAFQGTRYADEQDDTVIIVHPHDSWRRGGMYGYPLSDRHTAAVRPYFMGSPGSTIGPDTQGHNAVTGRWFTNFFHPFRPVGMYYDR